MIPVTGEAYIFTTVHSSILEAKFRGANFNLDERREFFLSIFFPLRLGRLKCNFCPFKNLATHNNCTLRVSWIETIMFFPFLPRLPLFLSDTVQDHKFSTQLKRRRSSRPVLQRKSSTDNDNNNSVRRRRDFVSDFCATYKNRRAETDWIINVCPVGGGENLSRCIIARVGPDWKTIRHTNNFVV